MKFSTSDSFPLIVSHMFSIIKGLLIFQLFYGSLVIVAWIWASWNNVISCQLTWPNNRFIMHPLCRMNIMWCDQAKWVWTKKTTTQFPFSLYAPISDKYYAENPIKIEHIQLDAQNNQIQRKLNVVMALKVKGILWDFFYLHTWTDYCLK